MARRNASELIMDITAVNNELILDTFNIFVKTFFNMLKISDEIP